MLRSEGKDVQNVLFEETVEHLLVTCTFAKIIWFVPPPANITNIFGNWSNEIEKLTKARIHIGVSAICWFIWNCRNNIVFNRSKNFHVLQVINMAAH